MVGQSEANSGYDKYGYRNEVGISIYRLGHEMLVMLELNILNVTECIYNCYYNEY